MIQTLSWITACNYLIFLCFELSAN